jgi:hypothetical protein
MSGQNHTLKLRRIIAAYEPIMGDFQQGGKTHNDHLTFCTYIM